MKDLRLYDTISSGYTSTRRADPRIALHVHAALRDARTVLNVGAGTGNYEPLDRQVVAVEPSTEMIGKRAPGLAPTVQAAAEDLPFPAGCFDAALAVLTVHHWADWQQGLTEMRRVAAKQVLFLFEPAMINHFWAVDSSYWPEAFQLPSERDAIGPKKWHPCSTSPTCRPSQSPSTAPTGSAQPSGGGRRPTSIPTSNKECPGSRNSRPRSEPEERPDWPPTSNPENGTADMDICATCKNSMLATGSSRPAAERTYAQTGACVQHPEGRCWLCAQGSGSKHVVPAPAAKI